MSHSSAVLHPGPGGREEGSRTPERTEKWDGDLTAIREAGTLSGCWTGEMG